MQTNLLDRIGENAAFSMLSKTQLAVARLSKMSLASLLISGVLRDRLDAFAFASLSFAWACFHIFNNQRLANRNSKPFLMQMEASLLKNKGICCAIGLIFLQGRN